MVSRYVSITGSSNESTSPHTSNTQTDLVAAKHGVKLSVRAAPSPPWEVIHPVELALAALRHPRGPVHSSMWEWVLDEIIEWGGGVSRFSQSICDLVYRSGREKGKREKAKRGAKFSYWPEGTTVPE